MFKHFAILKSELKTWEEVEAEVKKVTTEFKSEYTNNDFFLMKLKFISSVR